MVQNKICRAMPTLARAALALTKESGIVGQWRNDSPGVARGGAPSQGRQILNFLKKVPGP